MQTELEITGQIVRQLQPEYPLAEPDLSFDAMGMDSLDYVAFTNSMEEMFVRPLPRNRVFETPRKLAEWIFQNQV